MKLYRKMILSLILLALTLSYGIFAYKLITHDGILN